MKRIFATTAVLFAFASVASAQTATTDPVGFVSVTVPAQSDAVLAVPLNRSAAFKGKIQTISSNVITVAGTPAWTANQFVQAIPTQNDTFAIQIATGTKEGLIAKVTANGTNTLTVQFDAGDDLTGVKSVDVDGILNADEIDVLPYWTPASLFTTAPGAGVQILLIPTSTPGTNLSASSILVFTGSAWLNTSNFQSADHSPLQFAQAFILRNNAVAPLAVSLVGAVPMSAHRRLVSTLAANTPQDNWLGYLSPVPSPIGDTGLGFSAGDQLLVFDNSAVGTNKSASQILVYTGSAWLDTANFQNVSATFQMQPGFGYVLRRAQSASPAATEWKNLQAYLQ